MEKSSQIDDFWKKYLAAVLTRSIPEAKAEWYLIRAQRFAVSSPGPLRSRTVEQITAFFEDLAAQPNVQEWQTAQASDALKILYQEAEGRSILKTFSLLPSVYLPEWFPEFFAGLPAGRLPPFIARPTDWRVNTPSTAAAISIDRKSPFLLRPASS
jgi:hypothetical protein